MAFNLPDALWVVLKGNNPVVNQAVPVSTHGCRHVAHFLKEIKKELSNKLNHVAVDNITLHVTDDDPAMEPDAPLPAQNTAKTPLFVRVADGFALPPLVQTTFGGTGSISAARRVRFRRGLYRSAEDNLGFYEKRNRVRMDPFSYQDDGT